MSEDETMTDAGPPASAGLRALDRLVGVWQVTGDAQGTSRYEWMEGGHFMVQHFDLVHGGHAIKGMEVIGYLKGLDGQPSEEIVTRVYSALDGLTLDYVYELDGDTLTIWGGRKGSESFFTGRFAADGRSFSGAWQWPGGGYSTTSTKVDV
jgi:hypothetical protein